MKNMHQNLLNYHDDKLKLKQIVAHMREKTTVLAPLYMAGIKILS